MPWNWQHPKWPQFTYDPAPISPLEKQFLLKVGSSLAFLKNLGKEARSQFIVEILTLEGEKSSKIEGEILDRESLQSSLKQHFGLQTKPQKRNDKEAKMAKLLCDVYDTFEEPLSHEMLCRWHAVLFCGATHLDNCGKYRTHSEPMQIVSNRSDSYHVYFEAPPSSKVPEEMDAFIHWFNKTRENASILERAAIAHLYFESIHPFEDGNGRIGRLLVEKILSQGVSKPTLIAVSKVLEACKKEYYAALEQCNRTLEVPHWVAFFAQAILQAQEESTQLLHFLIEKAKMFATLQLNPRQEKVLLRMFAEGPKGFKGGLSAEKYIAITKTSRATATRDLQDLVEKNALRKTGELRHTRYHLNIRYYTDSSGCFGID